jgi:hypothetical protein
MPLPVCRVDKIRILQMKNINTKVAAYIVAGIVALVAAYHSWRKVDLSSMITWVRFIIPQSVAVTTVLWWAFSKWAWKWCLWRHWLVTVPNLSGTWSGLIYSNWQHPVTKNHPDPIPVQLSIHQTLGTIRCTQRTGESISTSFAEEIIVDQHDPSLIELVYCYQNTPDQRVRDRSNVHRGSCILRFSKSSGEKLEGSYWTNRSPAPTTGDIRLKLSSREILDALPEDIAPHPVAKMDQKDPSLE